MRAHGLRTWMRRLAPLVALSVAGCGLGGRSLATGDADTAQAQRDPISTVTGDSPNFSQMSNGTLMTVVSRAEGRGAKAGALVEFYYPHYATDHLWDSYVGVRAFGSFHWAHQTRLVGQRLAPDTGLTQSVFDGDGFRLTIEDVVRPRTNAHVRHVTITNTSDRPLTDLRTDWYSFFIVGGLPGGDRLRYDASRGSLVQEDEPLAIAVQPDRMPSAHQCGFANLPVGDSRDARQAAEGNRFSNNTSSGAVPTGVNGALAFDGPTLQPGQSTTLNFAIAVGQGAAGAQALASEAIAQGWSAIAGEDAARWQGWLSQARTPAGLPQDAQLAYRRALITLEQHVADNGAIIAAPTNLDPPYRFTWPRDGSIIALTLLKAGFRPEAERLFTFLEHVQKPDGGWAVNYFPDGSKPLWDFGTRGNEHDEVGTFAWGVHEVYQTTHDSSWLAARWPAVRKGCEFLLGQQQDSGLLTTCRDLWELSKDGTWTYSNAAAWAGLEAGAAIGQELGFGADAARYRAAADRLQKAVGTQLVSPSGFGRGLRGGKLDTTAEIANLALGSSWFGMFDDRDPRMAATAQTLASRLSTPWGGLRRYEGDKYYDGQPWPVATGWLGLYQLSAGDRSGARARFDVMTRYAAQTDSWMLGEQFDENRHLWVSAFPLAWSEATYVKLALDLFGGN